MEEVSNLVVLFFSEDIALLFAAHFELLMLMLYPEFYGRTILVEMLKF